jgi:hypothetical protein
MALVKTITGSYTIGFVLLATVAAACLLVLLAIDRHEPAHGIKLKRPGTAISHP